ncbi:MAG: hypothetical protein AMJ90_07690 [candidate division Zixibacteria bacterium SM23_73_2]|nr:MAG: hypothetical protein AMJ90_07690 [candidate division Zixibacteria bacterium SM23_73_2]
MVKLKMLLLFSLLFLVPFTVKANIVYVPADSSTIQAGINGAVNGDTVLVAPGTYYEHINFIGKAILVKSQAGPESTTITKAQDGLSIVIFTSGEDTSSILDGFTVTGAHNVFQGGGIKCQNSSPRIKNNIIRENKTRSLGHGAGIFCHSGHPVLEENVILSNQALFCGGGIFLGNCDALIRNNLIALNQAANGAGIHLLHCKGTKIENNLILKNSTSSHGGGVLVAGQEGYNNKVINNTIVKNGAAYGGGICIYYTGSSTVLNNIVVDSDSGAGIYLEESTTPLIGYNDVWNNNPSNYEGVNPSQGCISADPLFCDSEAENFYLNLISPCVGAGQGGVDMGAFGMGCHLLPGILHVSITGDDSTGNGTQDNPFRTIQKGIDEAIEGDTILAVSGTYYENITFKGKHICVASGFIFDLDPYSIKSTIIDAGGSGMVVSCTTGEDSNSIIQGFTIQNGRAGSGAGPGVWCKNSSPTIKHNILRSNTILDDGGVIHCNSSSPEIIGNIIYDNFSYWVEAPTWGAGIYCINNSSPKITNNTIAYNYSDPDHALMTGIYCFGESNPDIKNNIIAKNDESGIVCEWNALPSVFFNDVWGNGENFIDVIGIGDTTWGTNFNGIPCDSFYNIIRDPIVSDTINYALLCSSACIDAGDPWYDFPDSAGRRIDIGAFEYLYAMGDMQDNGKIDLSDVIYLANYLLKSGTAPCPLGSGDVNCDGKFELADAIYLANYHLKGGPKPGCP